MVIARRLFSIQATVAYTVQLSASSGSASMTEQLANAKTALEYTSSLSNEFLAALSSRIQYNANKLPPGDCQTILSTDNAADIRITSPFTLILDTTTNSPTATFSGSITTEIITQSKDVEQRVSSVSVEDVKSVEPHKKVSVCGKLKLNHC